MFYDCYDELLVYSCLLYALVLFGLVGRKKKLKKIASVHYLKSQ